MQSEELANVDPEGARQPNRRVDPREVSPRLHGTNELSADAGPLGQFALRQPCKSSVGPQIHANNLASLLVSCLYGRKPNPPILSLQQH